MRSERISFADIAEGGADTELELNVSAATVVHASSATPILSNLASGNNDFTVRAGAYLVELSATFEGSNDASVVGFRFRKASDNSNLTERSGTITPDDQAVQGSIKELLFLATATSLNVLVDRLRPSTISNITLVFVELGGESSGGSTPNTPADDFLFGTSADAVPVAGELTIAAANGAAEIPAYDGSQHVLLARLDSEADITSVTRSDDQSGTNQVGAFTKHSAAITVSGSDYNVWVSNQALTQDAAVTWTVR
ncbi:MAG: hypothetical protein F4147_09525 [Gammaproteobacteria bacterium]|nr:hypothetical protein [Gammaproteobacteria bacterium]